MELEVEDFSRIISDMFYMCEQHRLIGIPAYMAIGRNLPAGWWRHPYTQYFLPPNYNEQKGE